MKSPPPSQSLADWRETDRMGREREETKKERESERKRDRQR